MYSSRSRTKEWVSALSSDLPDSRSPVGSLSAKFSTQCIDGTPRRRLSLDADSSSPDTPYGSRILPDGDVDNVLGASLQLPRVTVNSGSPLHLYQSIHGFSFAATRPNDIEAEECRNGRFDAINAEIDQSDAIMIDTESYPVPQHASLTSLSSDFSNIGASPCPSSVFIDEDSQDSGYGGDSQDGFSKQANFLLPVAPAIRTRHKLSVPCIQEEIDDSGHNSDNDFGRLLSRPKLSADFSCLLNAPILYSTLAIENSANNSENHPTCQQRPRGSSADTETPVKNLGLLWGTKNRSLANRNGQPVRRHNSSVVLPAGKRPQKSPESPSGYVEAVGKRRRALEPISTNFLQPPQPSKFHRCHSESEIGKVLSKSSYGENLIGNYDRPHILPLHQQAKHSDLNCISSQTMSELLNGKYDSSVRGFDIIDCRYPYEYQGGHIQGAKNIYLKEDLMKTYFDSIREERILVFYCEFSSERAPTMTRFLRKNDRELNKLDYPRLFYPEIYLLDGGYKSFYERFKVYCSPSDYVPMLHKDHSENLRLFRSKVKSWDGADAMRPSKSSARVGLLFS